VRSRKLKKEEEEAIALVRPQRHKKKTEDGTALLIWKLEKM